MKGVNKTDMDGAFITKFVFLHSKLCVNYDVSNIFSSLTLYFVNYSKGNYNLIIVCLISSVALYVIDLIVNNPNVRHSSCVRARESTTPLSNDVILTKYSISVIVVFLALEWIISR